MTFVGLAVDTVALTHLHIAKLIYSYCMKKELSAHLKCILSLSLQLKVSRYALNRLCISYDPRLYFYTSMSPLKNDIFVDIANIHIFKKKSKRFFWRICHLILYVSNITRKKIDEIIQRNYRQLIRY